MKYTSGYKYQLYERESFQTAIKPPEFLETKWLRLSSSGLLIVRAGYAWDGPSGPTWDTKNSMRGSLFHDAIYQLIRQRMLDPRWRKVADEELGRFLKEDDMWWPRRALWVRELKKFGGSAADPKNKKIVHTAP